MEGVGGCGGRNEDKNRLLKLYRVGPTYVWSNAFLEFSTKLLFMFGNLVHIAKDLNIRYNI